MAVIASPVRPQGHVAYRTLTLKRRLILLGLFLLLLSSFVVDLMVGPARYGAGEVIKALVDPAGVPAALRVVIWEIRLPVALMAVVTGA